MNKSKCKPCPFCGSDGHITMQPFTMRNSDKQDVRWRAFCAPCGFQLRYQKSEPEAIAAWNRRQPCDKCDRIEKWVDHVGCTPNKAKRYEMLLEFCREVSKPEIAAHFTFPEARKAARLLLAEISEND